MKTQFIIFCGLISLSLCSLTAKDYSISNQAAFDAISGKNLAPGDKVLLKRGQLFKGMLVLSGTGEEGNIIRVTTFGDGARPQIHAGGKHIAALHLRNPSYVEVDSIEVTNTDGSESDQGDIFGIYVEADKKEKIYKHVYIDDCYVHDVNGKVAGKKRGGIHVHMKKLKKSRFDDLRITRNRVENVGGVGIGNASSAAMLEFEGEKVITENLWTRVYVAENVVDHTGRNNIIARSSKDAIYEHNTLANSSRYSTGHSIFCFRTDGIKIQYNEAYGNVGDEGKDRGGFDADYKCINTFIQYNYSHDNNWFCGIMKKPNRNVVIRYNISENDREGIYFYGFNSNKDARNIHIYNNTHFVRKGLDVSVFAEGRTPLNTVFENNIFYFEGKGEWGTGAAKAINTVFRNNLYVGIEKHPTDKQAILTKPHFLKTGITGKNIDLKSMKQLKAYSLTPNSSGIEQGLFIENNGNQDILSQSVDSKKVTVGAVSR